MPETTWNDLITIVNERDEPVGEARKADLLQRPGLHFRTSHVFIFSGTGELLLQQLPAVRDRDPLRWGSSVAAYVHPRETYAGAARRRARKELGLDIDPDLIGTTAMPDLGGVKHISLFASASERRQLRVLEPQHIARVAWAPVSDIARDVTEAPDRFTETFVWLFRLFYEDDGLRSAWIA
jgi:isopentenyldiphosphate isomerase